MPLRLILTISTLILSTQLLGACAETPERQALDQVNRDVGTVRQTVSTARTIRAILR